MQYKLIDHTADFGIHVFGKDKEALFAHAALAMFELIVEAGRPGDCRMRRVVAEGDDWPDLMVNWLRELLYLWSGEEKLVHSIDIKELSDTSVTAKVTYDVFLPKHHQIINEIKAVTYHQIQVKPVGNGWETRIIFDV